MITPSQLARSAYECINEALCVAPLEAYRARLVLWTPLLNNLFVYIRFEQSAQRFRQSVTALTDSEFFLLQNRCIKTKNKQGSDDDWSPEIDQRRIAQAEQAWIQQTSSRAPKIPSSPANPAVDQVARLLNRQNNLLSNSLDGKLADPQDHWDTIVRIKQLYCRAIRMQRLAILGALGVGLWAMRSSNAGIAVLLGSAAVSGWMHCRIGVDLDILKQQMTHLWTEELKRRSGVEPYQKTNRGIRVSQ